MISRLPISLLALLALTAGAAHAGDAAALITRDQAPPAARGAGKA